jgi:hypothetical protein
MLVGVCLLGTAMFGPGLLSGSLSGLLGLVGGLVHLMQRFGSMTFGLGNFLAGSLDPVLNVHQGQSEDGIGNEKGKLGVLVVHQSNKEKK